MRIGQVDPRPVTFDLVDDPIDHIVHRCISCLCILLYQSAKAQHVLEHDVQILMKDDAIDLRLCLTLHELVAIQLIHTVRACGRNILNDLRLA